MSLCPDCTAETCSRGLTGPARRLCQTDPRYHALITGQRDSETVPTAEQLAAAEMERELELRSAERRRCQYRSREHVRTEPCACSTIRLLPIYTCGLHACDCADLRQPQPPARCCLHCPDHSQAGPARAD